LCSFLHFPVTSSLLGSNIVLRTLFSDTLSLCCSWNVRDHVSHPYKTSGRIMGNMHLTCIISSVFPASFGVLLVAF
jgi:hypothetical protein